MILYLILAYLVLCFVLFLVLLLIFHWLVFNLVLLHLVLLRLVLLNLVLLHLVLLHLMLLHFIIMYHHKSIMYIRNEWSNFDWWLFGNWCDIDWICMVVWIIFINIGDCIVHLDICWAINCLKRKQKIQFLKCLKTFSKKWREKKLCSRLLSFSHVF